MINIDNANFKFKIKKENNSDFIFDEIRKKWYVITPEEWIRQNFVQYATSIFEYPKSLISIEKEIIINAQKKRFDIVVYKNLKPWMLVECKQHSINLDDSTLQQILSYNTIIQAKYIVITNGNNTYCWEIEKEKIELKNELPIW